MYILRSCIYFKKYILVHETKTQVKGYLYIYISSVRAQNLRSKLLLNGWTDFDETFCVLTRVGGASQLELRGLPGFGYTVQGTTNLTWWSTLGVAAEAEAGVFQFTDATVPAAAHRFHRVVSP